MAKGCSGAIHRTKTWSDKSDRYNLIVLQTVGVPGEGIAVILGVDRILDMCRTVVNVTGDITAAAYIARKEKCLEVPVRV